MTERKRSGSGASPPRKPTPDSQREIVPLPEARENASGTHVPGNLLEGGKPAAKPPRSRAALRRRTRTHGP